MGKLEETLDRIVAASQRGKVAGGKAPAIDDLMRTLSEASRLAAAEVAAAEKAPSDPEADRAAHAWHFKVERRDGLIDSIVATRLE